MPVSTMQPSFSGGELAPSLHARVDLAKYATGLKTCRNFLVQAHGGVANRSGTKFIAETKNSAKTTRLIPFEFNTTQTYVLELGHLTLRVIKDGGLISLAANPPAYAGSRSYDITETDSTDVNYPFVRHSNVNYILVSGTGLNVTPGSNAAIWHALTGLIIEIPTVYTDAQLKDVNFTQSADIMTLVHPSHPVQELKRYSHYAWDLVPVSFGTAMTAPANVAVTRQEYDSDKTETTYSYVVTSVKTETGDESVASSAASVANNNLSNTVTNTITWNAVSGADSYNVYKSRGGIYGFVGRATGTTFKDDNIESDSNDSPAIARTLFNTTNEYPATVNYYQQRLVFGQTNNDPQKIYMSQTGNYHNFNISEPLRDSDAVTFTIAANQVNEIRHLVPLSDLIILTSGGEWLMTSQDGVVSPSSVQVKPQGYRGSAIAPPIVIGNTIIHLQSKGGIIRDLAFALESDSYTGNDLTVLANHLFAGKTVKEWAYAQAPHSIVWAVLSDGTLAALTYMREHEVWGWSRHDTDGTFESVCTIAEGDEDATYFVVKRTIGGATKRYIERLNTRVFATVADAFFVDSGLSYDGTNTAATTLTLSSTGSTWTHAETFTLTANASTFVSGDPGNTFTLTIGTDTLVCTVQAYTSATVVTVKAGRDVPAAFRAVATAIWSKGVDSISGMGHLEGKTISILADGNVEAQKVVSSGAITISNPASKIHLGLPIQSDIQTLNLELGPPTQQGKKKSIAAVTLRVEESRGGKIGYDKDHLTEFKQRAYEPYGTATSLKTGDIKVTLPATWKTDGSIFYRQEDPLPMTLLAVIPEVSLGG